MYKTEELFDLEHTICKKYLQECEYPWEALPLIKKFIKELIEDLDKSEYKEAGKDVWVHNSVKIAPTASLNGPCIIGKDTEIRPGAYVRGNVIVGEGCVIGNSCELKNAIVFDKSQIPHFNYVGDAILGFHAHMGAGSIVSNLKADGRDIIIKDGKKKVESCNSVMNPGTIIGRNSNIYPLARVRGIVPANSIFKDEDNVVEKKK